jgi:hypothetical protein
MATTTTNFGWDIPQSTDLVKDGATAIAALGQDIDTALIDLKGGTTGQVLSKASGTDLDFSWVAQDDSNAIQNAIVDAKGDLIGASAADTPARLAVGANGTVLTADSAEATGLKWATAGGGLVLIKTQTIGSAVSSVTVTDAFSATYENYLITLTGGVGSTNSDLSLKLGSTATGYYYFEIYGTYGSGTVTGFSGNNATSARDFGKMTANSLDCNARIFSPNAAKRTTWAANYASSQTGQEVAWNNGFLSDSTQYTAFTLTPNTGTMTGGTIRVYGYQNS